MARRRIPVQHVADLLHRWTQGESIRSIARSTGIDRKTIRRYLAVAKLLRPDEAFTLDDDELEALAAVVQRSARVVTAKQHALAHHAERIRGLLALRMRLANIHALLVGEGLALSYATLRRYVRRELGVGVPAPSSRAA